jgi:hypothetical protein
VAAGVTLARAANGLQMVTAARGTESRDGAKHWDQSTFKASGAGRVCDSEVSSFVGLEFSMVPKRYELSAKQWARIGSLIAGKASDPGRTGTDNRLFVNALL